MTIEVIAQKRVVEGTGASRRLRRAGKVPGVVYGAGQEAVSIELDHNSLFYAMKDEAFHGAVLSLNLDGETVSVLLRDNQMHPWKPQVLHVDFQRINAALLQDTAEQALAAKVAGLEQQLAPQFAAGDYQNALTLLAGLRDEVDSFFDKVMVMAEDEAIKLNRLTLLSRLQALFLQVADISLLQK